MDPISYSSGANARMGGVDITISLTPSQAEALGAEAGMLADWFHTGLWALALLRSSRNAAGEPYIAGPNDWYTAINDLDNRLLPRLEGIRDAVVREHARGGGSIGDLALAMDVKRSTAQYRREAILTGRDRPSMWENWALAGGPDSRPVFDMPSAPGTPVAGGFVIGQRVRITGVSGPLADRTDLIGKTGEVTAEAWDGQITLRGLTDKPRETFADFLGFEPAELEAIEDAETDPQD